MEGPHIKRLQHSFAWGVSFIWPRLSGTEQLRSLFVFGALSSQPERPLILLCHWKAFEWPQMFIICAFAYCVCVCAGAQHKYEYYRSLHENGIIALILLFAGARACARVGIPIVVVGARFGFAVSAATGRNCRCEMRAHRRIHQHRSPQIFFGLFPLAVPRIRIKAIRCAASYTVEINVCLMV